MRCLVTGASGFIGRHVVDELRERGADVVALVRETSNTTGLDGVELATGDMTRAESLHAPIAGVDAVIHLAALLKAPWKPDFTSANVEGAANVAAACAAAGSSPALVVVSSLAAGGPVGPGDVRDESMPEIPVSRYGRAKLAAERAACEYAATVPTTIVRPPVVFGEHDRATLPLFRSAARGVVIAPVRGPAEISVVHARDLARALVAVAERGERVGGDRQGAGIYYAPAVGPIDFADFGVAIGRALGRRPRALRLPAAITFAASAAAEALGRLRDKPSLLSLDKYREATAGAWVCSGAKLRAQLDWMPADLGARLAQTAVWYRENGLI